MKENLIIYNSNFVRKKERAEYENIDEVNYDEILINFEDLLFNFNIDDNDSFVSYVFVKTTNKFIYNNNPRVDLLKLNKQEEIIKNICNLKLLRKNIKYILKRCISKEPTSLLNNYIYFRVI